MLRPRGFRTVLAPTFIALLCAAAGATADAADSGLQLHGFASQGYLKAVDRSEAGLGDLYGREEAGGSFEFNEFGISATATPVERLRIGIQIIAYDLGKYGNDEPQIDWAFGQYEIPTGSPWFDANVVVGRFKTGHGLYNDYRDLDMTRTSVFLPNSVYFTSFRDFFLAANGAQLNTSSSLGGLGSLDISGFVGTQNLGNDGPIADEFVNGIGDLSGPRDIGPVAPGVTGSVDVTVGLGNISSVDIKRFDGGYVNWNTPIDGLRIKGSLLHAAHLRARGDLTITQSDVNLSTGGTAPNPDAGSVTAPVVVDVSDWHDIVAGVEYLAGDWTLASEVDNQYYKAQVESALASQSVFSRTQGAYGSVNYQFGSLPDPWNHLQVFVVGNWSRTLFDNTADYYTRSASVALRYDVTEHFLVKGEFQRSRETRADGQVGYWNLFSFKTTFDF